MKIRSIKLTGHRQFADERMVFGERLNVILGEGGTGKTVLFNAIMNCSPNGGDGVEVLRDYETSGEYENVFYVGAGCKWISTYTGLEKLAAEKEVSSERFHAAASEVYQDICGSRPPAGEPSLGEKSLSMYSYFFAIMMLEPSSLVVDDALEHLDQAKAEALFKYIAQWKGQMVLFMKPSQWEMISPLMESGGHRIFLLECDQSACSTGIIEGLKK